jgi:N-terminal domain of (some) glycogen debranching enzymes
LLNGGPISYYTSRIFLTNRPLRTEDGPIPPRTLGLTISRQISGGMHEDLDITNNSQKAVKFQLEIGLRCDFADIFEVKSGSIVRRGRIATDWSEPHQHLRATYHNGDFSRAVIISPAHSSAKAVYANALVYGDLRWRCQSPAAQGIGFQARRDFAAWHGALTLRTPIGRTPK